MQTGKQKIFSLIFSIVLVFIAGGFFFYRNLNKNNSLISIPTPSQKQITMDQVTKHADQNSCWMVIEGNVYDATPFISGHPGGEAILLGCGKDATSMFNSRPNDGTSHSSRARNTLLGLQIGVLR